MQTAARVDERIALPDGRWLAYAEFGDPDGRPVLFLHGTPGYRLNPWATDAELRSAGVRLIAPDRPGVGRSTPQPRRRLRLPARPVGQRHRAGGPAAAAGCAGRGAAARRARLVPPGCPAGAMGA